MGKYRHELDNLINLRDSNSEILRDYSYLMNDVGKGYHTSKAQYYDNQIMRMLPMVLDEMLEEVTRRFDIKVKNEATPALQELRREIERLGR